MSKHTPGPWEAEETRVYMCPPDEAGGGFDIICCPKPEANAKLIAKSPDLLDLVKQLMDEYRPDASRDEAYYPVWALADAIIKDIEG